MDILLIILSFLFLLVGLAGCILPIIPGPPIAYLSLLMLHFTKAHQFESRFLWFWAIAVIVVTVIDNVLPIWGTRKFGGSRRGTWGATIGLVFGMFFAPVGIIIGPFLGAVVGELTKTDDIHKALRSGLGSLLGFLMGTGLKLTATGFIIYYFFSELF